MRIHYQDFMIFFTFLLFWISIQFGQIIEDSIAYIIVLSIGIVHGSNDFTILKKQQNSKIDFLKSTGFYLSLIILCVVTYIIVPFLSIIFFVFLSSYHFGEQHLENKFNGDRVGHQNRRKWASLFSRDHEDCGISESLPKNRRNQLFIF